MIPIEYLVIDTWVWIEYFRGSDPAIKEVIESRGDVALLTSAITITEIIRKYNGYPQKLLEEMIQLINTVGRVVNVDQGIAAAAGRLRNEGFPGGTADAIILATALQVNGRVMTGDLHFKGLYDTLFVGS
jgi:predicted nucleic acid-binding protein